MIAEYHTPRTKSADYKEFGYIGSITKTKIQS